MSKSANENKKFWPIYKAINFNRLSLKKPLTCTIEGKEFEISYFGSEEIRASIFLSAFSAFLWVSPAISAILATAFLGFWYPCLYLYAIAFVIAYHFVGMYYVIQSPMLILKEKKKGFFSKK